MSLYAAYAQDSSFTETIHAMLSRFNCCGEARNEEYEYHGDNALIKYIIDKNRDHMQKILTQITKHNLEIENLLKLL